jgi:hypothetical protein
LIGQDYSVRFCVTVSLVPVHNSLSKASALKVDTALRKVVALSLKGERHKNLATYPSCLESYRLELIKPARTCAGLELREPQIGIILAHDAFLSTPEALS